MCINLDYCKLTLAIVAVLLYNKSQKGGDEMQVLSMQNLAETDFRLHKLEVFPESWATRKSFSLYKAQKRPCSALFFVKTDIRVHFFTQNGEKITVKRGGVAYIPQGVSYHVQVEGGTPNGIDTYTVNHTLTDGQGDTLLLSGAITLLCERAESSLDMYFQKLSEAVHRSATRLHICSCFYGLLDAVIAMGKDRSDTYYAIRAGAERLREEWHRNEHIEVYAALCGVSNAYFYRCFRAWSGQSPVEYRNALRLSHAEAMLRNTDMQIGEIAEVIGFEDPFYFCRLFTRRFGISPQKYRNGVRF